MQRERRQTTRLIMRVPMWVQRLARHDSGDDEDGVESLNISIRGAYFATGGKFEEGEKITVRLWMPEQIASGQRTEWCFTGRITHVERLGTTGKNGVGVHFLYYTAGKKLPLDFASGPRTASAARAVERFPHIT
ncbi:MAG TPA: hypothetical protein VJR23_05280 [Candidatus Acidoferrales bacterium]|nr:hypothetical protein [Candidatus Acidoferrales bacterium]